MNPTRNWPFDASVLNADSEFRAEVRAQDGKRPAAATAAMD